MKLLTFQEIKQLKDEDLEDNILEVQKNLFDLKIKQATKKTVKTHLFKRYKKMLAQLMTVKK